MPRTQPDSSTRDQLLDAAEELMITRGYVATSLDAICSAAGVTKGSFFHYFPNKQELGKVLLERFTDRQGEKFIAAMEGVEDPLERVYAMIDVAIEVARQPGMKGCLVGTFAQEISETHPELRAVCGNAFGRFAERVGRDLSAAKEAECPNADFDAAALGGTFLSIAQGSMLIARATEDQAQMVANLTHLKGYLRHLYGR